MVGLWGEIPVKWMGTGGTPMTQETSICAYYFSQSGHISSMTLGTMRICQIIRDSPIDPQSKTRHDIGFISCIHSTMNFPCWYIPHHFQTQTSYWSSIKLWQLTLTYSLLILSLLYPNDIPLKSYPGHDSSHGVAAASNLPCTSLALKLDLGRDWTDRNGGLTEAQKRNKEKDAQQTWEVQKFCLFTIFPVYILIGLLHIACILKRHFKATIPHTHTDTRWLNIPKPQRQANYTPGNVQLVKWSELEARTIWWCTAMSTLE